MCVHVKTRAGERYQFCTSMTRANWFRNVSLFAGILPLGKWYTALSMRRISYMIFVLLDLTRLNVVPDTG